MARTPKVVEDRRSQIAEAALQVFAERGFANASNKDIARQAGITPGLIYHYFESREALLGEIIEKHSASRMMRALPPGMMDLPADILLKSVALRILENVEDEKYLQIIRIVLTEIVHRPEIGRYGISDIQDAARFIATILQAKKESGELQVTDPEMTAQVFLSMLMGFVLRRQIFQDPSVLKYSHEQIADSVVTQLLESMKPA